MLEIGSIVNYAADLHWSSDWNGYEVGYPEISVVGLYTDKKEPYAYYINTETGEVLDAWTEDEEE